MRGLGDFRLWIICGMSLLKFMAPNQGQFGMLTAIKSYVEGSGLRTLEAWETGFGMQSFITQYGMGLVISSAAIGAAPIAGCQS